MEAHGGISSKRDERHLPQLQAVVPVQYRDYENGLLTGVKVASSLFTKARRERNCEQAQTIKSISRHLFFCLPQRRFFGHSFAQSYRLENERRRLLHRLEYEIQIAI